MLLGNLLQRMIFWELMKVFILSLVGITGILLLAGIVAEASQQGLSPTQILSIIPLLIPSTLPYTIPATTLFATCVVYGRLAADNEILAIRASGVNILKVVRPAVTLGLLTSAVTMALYFSLIPYTHHLMRSMFLGDVEGLLYSELERKREVKHPHLNYEMYVRGVQGKRLVNPTFKGKNKKTKRIEFVAQAREAELFVDKARNLILVHMQHGQAAGKGDLQGFFRDRIWEVPIPDELYGNGHIRARDLTWEQLNQREAVLQKDLNSQMEEIRAVKEGIKEPNLSPSQRKQHAINLEHKAKALRAELLALLAEFQMRPALALGCLFFVLVGCPVGIWFSKSDYLSSFITCFLPIIIIYYPLVLAGTGLAKEGHNPILTVWLADIVMGLLSLVLFWRLTRY